MPTKCPPPFWIIVSNSHRPRFEILGNSKGPFLKRSFGEIWGKPHRILLPVCLAVLAGLEGSTNRVSGRGGVGRTYGNLLSSAGVLAVVVNAVFDITRDALDMIAMALIVVHAYIPSLFFCDECAAWTVCAHSHSIMHIYLTERRSRFDMAIYTIGDLHLSTNARTNKSMEVFGRRWQGYVEKLSRNWETVVTPDDTVVIPGDISWAMKLEEALPDFLFLNTLPGHKLIGKGNHDFWWMTAKKMNDFFEKNHLETLHILNNNAYLVEGQVLCGTRGWFLDEKQQVAVGEVDYEKIVNREVIRLRLSLDEAVRLQKDSFDRTGITPPISVFLHFPPVWLDFVCRPFVDVLHEYGNPNCYFGHIHGYYNAPMVTEFEGIRFRLVASDALDFTLYRLNPVS